jgi:ribose 1,5-bisphosphokinase PhnN
MVLQTVRTTLDATRTAWAEHGKHYDLPAAIRNSIQQHMDAVAIGD